MLYNISELYIATVMTRATTGMESTLAPSTRNNKNIPQEYFTNTRVLHASLSRPVSRFPLPRNPNRNKNKRKKKFRCKVPSSLSMLKISAATGHRSPAPSSASSSAAATTPYLGLHQARDDNVNDNTDTMAQKHEQEHGDDRSMSDTTTLSPTQSSSSPSVDGRKRFGDCALVEIIHLHDCLRGAIHALQKDFTELSHIVLEETFFDGIVDEDKKKKKPDNADPSTGPQQLEDGASADSPRPSSPPSSPSTSADQIERLVELESRSNARFQVIWSVFRAHSAAEDEFIWPALRSKTRGEINGSPCNSPKYQPGGAGECNQQTFPDDLSSSSPTTTPNANGAAESRPKAVVSTVVAATAGASKSASTSGYESTASEIVEQEEYEEDHADEERMFTMMDHLLRRLRKGLNVHQTDRTNSNGRKRNRYARDNVVNTMKEIMSLTKTLTQHLFVHLEKEENQCLPLVVKHMTKSEIHDLVGQIMGKRSSDMIAQILTMAVQNLDEADQEGMVKHMKQAMAGTFFDQWLSMSGWMDGKAKRARAASIGTDNDGLSIDNTTIATAAGVNPSDSASPTQVKRLKSDSSASDQSAIPLRVEHKQRTDTASSNRVASADDIVASNIPSEVAGEITSHAELEKLIRAVATNQSLTPREKQNTIQGLRASVWKRNQRLLAGESIDSSRALAGIASTADGTATSANTIINARPPAAYYVMGEDEQVYRVEDPNLIPNFPSTELSATYNVSTSAGRVLGCPHYARACKLRHPVSGRLHTCRICCEQKREASSGSHDNPEPPLDRYAVKEVLCMECTTLQPANKRCIQPECTLHTKSEGFARYYCDICHLYDDRPTVNIFHCPYCNTCRLGKGLGIDYRHCMRCNACVAINEEHRCIPQKLQGSCPICHETLFNSTEPMKGIQCGHVMHLSCFNEYRREQNYACPLCMRCMEDMSEYFSMLDQAVALQAMPMRLQNTMSNIYCQDCEKTGQCRFHFVGLKCPNCGSYNTREMNRFEARSSAANGES